VTYNDFMDLLCPPEGDAEDWALLAPPAETEAAAAAPPGVKRQLSRIQPKGGGELAQLAQAQDKEEAEVEAEFKRYTKTIYTLPPTTSTHHPPPTTLPPTTHHPPGSSRPSNPLL